MCNKSWRPLRANKSCFLIGVYCMQKDWLGKSSKATNDKLIQDCGANISSKEVHKSDGLVQPKRYLSPTNADQLIVYCVGTVLPSRSFCIKKTPILANVTKIPQRVVVGYQNFAWGHQDFLHLKDLVQGAQILTIFSSSDLYTYESCIQAHVLY
jgi:hypothetical protein